LARKELMLVALLIFARAVHIAASILIAGSFTFDVIALGSIRQPARDDLYELQRNLLRLTVWALVAALVSALLWFWLEVVSMTSLSFLDSFSASRWKTVLLETVFGHVWQLRLGVIAAALLLAVSALAGNDMPRHAAVLALWVLSVVLLVSLAWISHAAAAGVQPMSLIGDALHLCAAGAWIGGLIPLVVCLIQAPVSPGIAKIIPHIISRFSTLSLCCVSVLIVTGISNSWLLVGTIHALFTTIYGWLLLLKLALFATVIRFGARNQLAIKASASTAQTRPDFLHQLRCSVISEICLSAAVLVIVACLGVTPPARHP
jgi:putative copper resistance protein D